MTTSTPPINPPYDAKLDLEFERIVDVPPELVWAAWTMPEHIVHWFTPAPWKTIDCKIDLRPGGLFNTTMRSPEGQDFPNSGCFLEIIPNRKLVWTNALAPGFRPATIAAAATASSGEFIFTAVVSMARHGSGTQYTARVMHSDESGRKQHEDMGFHQGWNAALDQLVTYMQAKK